jgi:putative aldouronate transport system substrate-binding protein
MKNTPESIAANDLWYYANKEIAGKGKMPVGVTLTAEESDELTNIEASLGTYVPEMSAKFITGEATKADWENYLKELDKMGLARALEIRQAAYDRFLAR